MFSKTMTILVGIIEQQPVNAYELNKWLTTMNVREWYNIASSTVYATLKAAEKKGYITGSIEKSGNMPDKTVYTVTDRGRQEFMDTITGYLSDFDYDITPFHIGMFFINALDNQMAVDLLGARVRLLQKYSLEIEKQTGKMEGGQVPQIYVLNTRQSLYIVQAQLKGAEEILEELSYELQNVAE